MKQLMQYIFDILATDVNPEPIPNQQLGSLPMFIGESYQLYNLLLLNQQLVLVEPKGKSEFSTLQTEKHLKLLKDKLEKKLVLVLNEITAYERKKLIEKGINFIVPGKQLYLPDLLIDLRESYTNPRAKRKIEKLLPSAQFMVIYHILHRNEEWKLEEHSFKEIAKELGYTAMAITKAVNNLKYHEIIDVEGEKEKFIRFKHNRSDLWQFLEHGNLFVNPVLKRVYVDEKPSGIFMLHTNTSALHEYSDLNPGMQAFYAIEKTVFYGLQKNKALLNPNEYEGRYCLEVWKYNPETLVAGIPNNAPVVDPLSLYLSIEDLNDERIEMALEQIKEKFIW